MVVCGGWWVSVLWFCRNQGLQSEALGWGPQGSWRGLDLLASSIASFGETSVAGIRRGGLPSRDLLDSAVAGALPSRDLLDSSVAGPPRGPAVARSLGFVRNQGISGFPGPRNPRDLRSPCFGLGTSNPRDLENTNCVLEISWFRTKPRDLEAKFAIPRVLENTICVSEISWI